MLKVENLNVYYDNIHALKGIDISVNKGEIVCLIGANGAGKTTTLQSISGLIPKKEGSVIFEDKDITKTKANIITKLGIAQVPEGRRVFTGLSVIDNLKLGAFTIKDSQENIQRDIEKIYERFPILKERKNQLAGTLSGGEQQMLAMGRAIMSRPRLILLDEPSMGLSPLFVEKIFEVIKTLKEEGVTILLVEQNANLALSISDRAYVLETGKIVSSGSAKELSEDSSVKEAYLGA
ncbi:branched-chain amino acid transport system ATP-binding protein [Anaerosphaera aminiphila DSM 21120]|uniref:Branched-chain amino acid transport system ATP-binding protein n=1 Tax=Anaerosphaera aminiphila DSM 21120 TaxID=1120995 RepID=A0A1M5T2C4_9FIRM|nr:ABC transporter ATP-binding protein [Anaerosphaera aminiphila]SHH44887.1 branched-chain amino acid transport system ATP-binding protein [Anaerosphaera aminiphila DSM 21120]